MKTEAKLFVFIGLFAVTMAVIYGIFTAQSPQGLEPVGLVALILTAGLGIMCGFFFWWTGRKTDLRPDDDPDGDIAAIEGDYGFFSPHSWWPLFLGAACGLVMFGAAVGWWLVILAMPLLVLAVIGWTFEYFKGEDAI
ncbi:cytochrome c oxidase subunit 4 [Calidifontibacter sp. DB0510]|uniref:Cytochrome c oxidase polypeptide 4 n=1 Tax=Metallococcus carri TaxID=1656884 RepID=A0A967B0V0_9MICO|nr:cytochrome c oxidase subunit 4 [Metallococcus carri]NHN55959.1 cytochrome c oxidase subunit 4 [Metallococcus carri]NOP37584.1 cytochrome c oxidase subunit 4 [Calidifontibacter sp. DB2511S]